MASVPLQPPAPFCFSKTDEWPKWKRRFEQYRLASGLSEKSDECQASTLLYCLGTDSDDVLTTTRISDDDRKKYNKVLEKFDEYFKVRHNVIFERARFNRRNQHPGESAEDYITVLHQLAQGCEYGEMTDELIRDRLVVGIRDESLSERLQIESKLTLEQAKRFIRQREAIHQQQSILKGKNDSQTETLEPMYVNKGKNAPGNSSQVTQRQPLPVQPRHCRRCGKTSHPRQMCPANNATCFRCNRKGHFSSQCLSKTVGELTALSYKQAESETNDDPYSDTVYLSADTVYLDTVSNAAANQWNVTVLVGSNPVKFKVDTGAEVTALSEETFRTFTNQVRQLQKSPHILRGANRSPLDVVGEGQMTLTYNDKSSIQRVFVVRELQHNLLGLPAIRDLEIITGINAVQLNIPDQYPALFSGLGTFKGEYTINLKPDAQPFSLFTPRNVPIPLREKVSQELQRMESLGVISKVTEPTPWCAAMVVVPKPSGSVRICVDFRPLNGSVMREIHPMPKVDVTLAQLNGAKVFSKLDTNSGFWQVPLAKESRLLTTFITPQGRFCFNKLPFGITSAPEHFQRRMSEILDDIPGVVCHVDDVLVSGKDQEEHNARLNLVLQKIQTAGLTLNKDKCQFSCSKIVFLGHVIDADGISPDPHKTEAIRKLSTPTTVTELRRFMGMINQLNKFSPRIAEISQPLRELLKSNTAWVWTPNHGEALQKLKEEIASPRVLAHYNLNAETKISADASSHGLGAVLLQRQDNYEWKPVAFASRSLNEIESRYAQIEKEALALVWSAEKFSDYVLGKPFLFETDHKPLVPLLGNKRLDSLPPRVLRFRLRLARFQYSIYHVPGKTLYMADTLSRAPIKAFTQEVTSDTELFMQSVVSALPATKDYLDTYRTAQLKDNTCSRLMQFCDSGWPNHNNVKGDLRKYWQVRASLSVNDNILLYGSRIVVPEAMRVETLRKIHQGHQGFQKCRSRVSAAVWWPGIMKSLDDFIKACPECQQTLPAQREPLLSTTLPSYPWEKLAMDLFDLKGKTYILLVDYYSRFVEIQHLQSTTTSSVISFLKPMFARYGVPVTLISDNGPQFTSAEMRQFAETYGFHHVTSSPYYPQANGQAERTVRTIKNLLQNANDPFMALLSYRATPMQWCSLSPAELLQGRKIRTDVPQPKSSFIPQWTHTQQLKQLHDKYKSSQSEYYNKRHRVRSLPPLPDNTPVWVQTDNGHVPGTVVQPASTPRSYIVSTPTGQMRRNRINLRPRQDTETLQRESGMTETSNVVPGRVVTRSQSGTAIKPPDRLRF